MFLFKWVAVFISEMSSTVFTLAFAFALAFALAFSKERSILTFALARLALAVVGLALA